MPSESPKEIATKQLPDVSSIKKIFTHKPKLCSDDFKWLGKKVCLCTYSDACEAKYKCQKRECSFLEHVKSKKSKLNQ